MRCNALRSLGRQIHANIFRSVIFTVSSIIIMEVHCESYDSCSTSWCFIVHLGL